MLVLFLTAALSLPVATYSAGISEVCRITDNASQNAVAPSLMSETLGFNRTYGGTRSDSPCALVQTSDGGYAIAGSTNSFGAGNYDFWLVKTDAEGNMVWNKTYGGADYEWAEALVATSDGGYAILGYTLSFGIGTWGDFWLVKTDDLGNMQWNMTYGAISNAYPGALLETSDGGYAMAGGLLAFGSGGSGKYDFWLVKTDPVGNPLWNRTYGRQNDDALAALIETSDGGYALAGSSESSVRIYDFLLVKTDAAGNAEWNVTMGGAKDDFATALAETSDGGYAIAGQTTSFNVTGDAWLVKTDSLGNMQWNRTYGGNSSEWAYALVAASDGGCAMAGYTSSFGVGGEAWIIKADELGDMQWSKTFGGADYDCAVALVATSDGGYAIAGETCSYGSGEADYWLVKIDENGAIPEFRSAPLVFIMLVTVSLIAIIAMKKFRVGFLKLT